MKKTFLEIKQADELVAQIYARNPNLERGKFGWAWKRFIEKNLTPLSTELGEKLLDNRIQNALIDPNTKEILYGDVTRSSFKFDREGTQAIADFNRKLTKEYNEKEWEVIPYICTDVPEMSDEEREVLRGLVID